MAGEVIDMFTRQKVRQNPEVEPPTPDDFVDEAQFVAEFMDVHMGEFLAEVQALDDAETIEDLESQIRRIKTLVRGWPRMPG